MFLVNWCTSCSASFRRQVRTLKNGSSIKWICSGRNYNGTASCPNKTVIDESEMIDEIKKCFSSILMNKPNNIKKIIHEFNKQYKEKSENKITEKEDITNDLFFTLCKVKVLEE